MFMQGQSISKFLDATKVHTSVFDRKFMYLSDIIDPIYREYLIKLEKIGVNLDLDVIRRRHQVENYTEIIKFIVGYLNSRLKNPTKGNILISMNAISSQSIDITPAKYHLMITDDSVVMTVDSSEQYSALGAKIKSRLGFGTSISFPIREPYDSI